MNDKHPICVKSGSLEVRVASNAQEIRAAQELRYRVFYEELEAKASNPIIIEQKRDFDDFDDFCEHLIAIDHQQPEPKIIGTYRMLRRAGAERKGCFYTASEFDITKLEEYPGEVLEVGRSCVDVNYRSRSVMQILWQGIAAYLAYYDIKLLFGCASLHGNDLSRWAHSLSYLHHYHLAPPALRVKALPEMFINMNNHSLSEVDSRKALHSLPPLVKGYLRLGGFVGDGAVIDPEFNTIDVCVMVKTDLIKDKYAKHYARTTKDSGASS